MSELEIVLRRQSGVVSRRQLVDLGLARSDIRRGLRRGQFVPHLPGVYLTHTGHPLWIERSWAAVLALWPAALSHRSALRVDDAAQRLVVDTSVIHVAVDRHRSPVVPSGVRVHHVSELDALVRWHLTPPRVSVERALIDVAAETTSEQAILTSLANAIQTGRTTAARLRADLGGRTRVAQRPRISRVLDAVAEGVHSPLELGYVGRVERPHGLPSGRRQVAGRCGLHDVEYDDYDLVVELDGRQFHDSASARDIDMERDLDAALDGRRTLRLGHGQIFDRACSTAAKVGRLLNLGGWTGTITSCAHCRSQWGGAR